MRTWVTIGVFLGLILLLLCLVVTCRFDEVHDVAGSVRKRNFTVGLAEGVSVRRHGIYGVDFIRCGKCRMEKRKLGALTLGGFNVLVLEDLSLVIPPRELAGDSVKGEGGDAVSARELADGLGLNEGFLKSQGFRLRFSGLKVSGLSVATLDAASNAVPRFVAANGTAERDGLHLAGCGIITNNSTNAVGSAVLKVKPDLRLVWPSGELKL